MTPWTTHSGNRPAREYRVRLIFDVVTAKLDVRDAAAPLREEPDEPEALDEANTLSNPDEEIEVMDEVEE